MTGSRTSIKRQRNNDIRTGLAFARREYTLIQHTNLDYDLRIMSIDAVTSVGTTTNRLLSQPRHRIFTHSNLWLIFAIVCGLAIRLYRLDERSIWFDETASWRTSQFPLREMIERIASDCHPPLYYLCLKLWTALFGDSLWALRGLSVALAGVLIVGVYLLVRELYDEAHGLNPQMASWAAAFAALLVAFSPIQIRMAWEARMYTLGAALAVLSSWLLLVAWRRGNSLRLWLSYGAAALLFAHTHYYALFTILGQFLFLTAALVAKHRTCFRAVIRDVRAHGALASGSVIALGWLPWLPTFLTQRHQIEEEWWTMPLQASHLLEVCHSMLLGVGALNWLAVAGAAAMALIVVALVVSRTLGTALLSFLIVCPILLSTVYSLLYRNIIMDRFFVFTHVFILSGAAVLVGRITDTVVRNTVATLLVSWSLLAYYNLWSWLDIENRPGARGAAEFILSNAERGESVIVSSPLIYYPMLYHLRGRMDCKLLKTEVLAHYVGGPFSMPDDFIETDEIAEIRDGRAWVVTGGWDDRSVSIPPSWMFHKSEQFQEVYRFQGWVKVGQYRVGKESMEAQPGE